MKKLFCWTAAVLLAVPAGAGVSLDRNSPSIALCGASAAEVYRLGKPSGGCDVAGPGPVKELSVTALALTANDNVDGLSANTLTPPDMTYYLLFSADRTSLGQMASPYAAEAANNQAGSDLWRTLLTGGSPAASMTGAGCVPWMVFPPHFLHRNQTSYNLIQTAPAGAAVAAPLDDIDAVEMDVLDFNGDNIHDVNTYFSLDSASPSAASGADIFFAPMATAAFITFSMSADIGLATADDIDALVMWDRGMLGAVDPGVDFALFSLAPGSPTLAAFGLSAAMIFVTDFSGAFCPFVATPQLGLRPTDNVDGLDVIP